LGIFIWEPGPSFTLAIKGIQLLRNVDLETAVADFDEYKPFLKDQFCQDQEILDLKLQLLDWLECENV
jgi:hypothetical protein